MSTRENPGAFDCYHKAAPDEPMFTFLARDPIGGELVMLWAFLRDKEFGHAAMQLGHLVYRARKLPPARPEKIESAIDCAKEMFDWRVGQGGPEAWTD